MTKIMSLVIMLKFSILIYTLTMSRVDKFNSLSIVGFKSILTFKNI